MENNQLPFNGDTKNFHADIKVEDIPRADVGPMVVPPQMQVGMLTPDQTTVKTSMTMSPTMAAQMGQPVQPKKKHTVLIASIISVVVLLVAGLSTYFLAFTPEKRMNRKYDKAVSAMDEGDYRTAVDNFKEYLEYDETNSNAMLGVVYGEYGLQDKALTKDYEKYRKYFVAQDEIYISEAEQQITDFYVFCEKVYPTDDSKQLEVIEEGMDILGDLDVLVEMWSTRLVASAMELEETLPESAADIYNTVLEKDPTNSYAKSARSTCVRTALDNYMAISGYDQAEELISKYEGVVTDINFVEYSNEIAEKKRLKEKAEPLMQEVWAAMEAGDYEKMCEIDGSTEADSLVKETKKSYLYAPDGFTEDYTGIAVGLYKTEVGSDFYSDYWYCFYYGEYVNGVRSGHGVTFCVQDQENQTYTMYNGEWENDMPNGYGVSGYYHELNSDEFINTIDSGNFVDGYCDGDFETRIESSAGYTVMGSWHCDNGQIVDVRDQYPELELPEYEDRIIYVVLQSDETDIYWWCSQKPSTEKTAHNWKKP